MASSSSSSSAAATPADLAALVASALRPTPAGAAAPLDVARSDDRQYRLLTLANGLRAIVCSDPSTDMSAAALEVSVGSFSDGDVEGLAHFCEHMCFLGTEKFPDENSFGAFLNEHGGSSNAYTASELTNYQFDISSSAGQLGSALERFASFFSCPLFTESATGRELMAVDSEHAKNLQNDSWRSYQLDKATSAPGHPYARFGTGDSRTLRDEPLARGVSVRERLLAFHAAHYSASRMTLAVVGSEPVAELAAFVERHFSAIKNNGSAPPVFAGHPHDGRLGLRLLSAPIKDLRQLQISWALPEQKSDWRGKAASYASHLLGHEGPGSVLSLLKRHGWAESLHAGLNLDDSGAASFCVTVGLSEAGLARAEDAEAAVYAYLGVLRAHGAQRWVFDEVATQSSSSFRFQSKYDPFSYATQLAAMLAERADAPEQTLSAGSLFFAYEPERVAALLARFTPENARVRLTAKALAPKCDRREAIYGTSYAEERASPEALQRLAAVAEASRRLTLARLAELGGGASCLTGGPAWRSGGGDDKTL